MEYRWRQEILFRHCDPAGIVFYPRYFEMLNDGVEQFFAKCLGLPFAKLHEGSAIPTVDIRLGFQAPSRLGDVLDMGLRVSDLGRTSMTLEYEASCDGQARLKGQSTLVFVGRNTRPQPWPEDLRARVNENRRGEA